MKKLLLLFAVAAAMMTGCKNRDYGCNWYYEIYNGSESEIIWIAGVNETSITPGSKQQIYRTGTDCGKNARPEDIHTDADEKIIGSTHQLKIDGIIISDTIWMRKFWTFENKAYSATYTLAITDELIRQQEEL
jgi:hypothetical protein